MAYLDYRLYEDLRRGWRITQSNLEQYGLLRIDYLDLQELCAQDDAWQTHAALAASSPAQHEATVRALLEHMRRELAINAPALDPERQGELLRQIQVALKAPWSFSDRETRTLRRATRFVVPDDQTLPAAGTRSFSMRSQLGRFLRSPQAGPVLEQPLDEAAYEALLHALLDALVGAGLLVDVAEKGPRAVQLRCDALLWCAGDGSAATIDPIRSRCMREIAAPAPRVNTFFQQLYRQPPQNLHTIQGREHTGQVV